jgi:hypothetical protein
LKENLRGIIRNIGKSSKAWISFPNAVTKLITFLYISKEIVNFCFKIERISAFSTNFPGNSVPFGHVRHGPSGTEPNQSTQSHPPAD